MDAAEQFAGKEHAETYSQFRRDAPVLLAEKILSYLKEKYEGPLDIAVDAGCGSGQGTVILSPFFNHVLGIDVAEMQIEEAKKTRARPNVAYKAAPAEILPFADNSVQLVAAGAALHWMKMDVFFKEVQRVLCNNGILAVYCYYSVKPVLDDPNLDEKIGQLYSEFYEITKEFHAPEAQIAMEKYENVHFPFKEVLRVPDVRETFEGRLSDIIGYISSFSGFQNLKKRDEAKAKSVLSNFFSKLKEIVGVSDAHADEPRMLYRDFLLIICRKVNEI